LQAIYGVNRKRIGESDFYVALDLAALPEGPWPPRDTLLST
jgi:hypothetical protein